MFLERLGYFGCDADYNDLYYLSCYHLLQGTKQASRYAATLRTCSGVERGLTFSRLMIYICRTAPLTSGCCILYIYSTNIRTEYFKHAAHSLFFSLQNAVYFIMLPFLVPVLFTF